MIASLVSRPAWVAGVVRRAVRLGMAYALVGGADRLAAQEMEIPVAVQIPLFLKVTTFDRNRHGSQPLNFGVVFQSRNRASLTAKDEVLLALEAIGAAAEQVHAVTIDLDRENLAEALDRLHPTVVYVTPLRAISITDLAAATRAAHVTTFTGVPAFVEGGLAVGVRLERDRPKLLINLTAARAEGADFGAELLKLARVTP